jgi:hypothetical protein
MTTTIRKHQLENEYDHTMLQCVRCDLKDEMNKCKTCKINNNLLKKANNRFPDAIVDLINSFNVCKKCVKTIDLIRDEPAELNIEEANLWYFVKLNPLPSRTVINKCPDLNIDLKVFKADCMRYGNYNSYHTYKMWYDELWKPKEVDMNKLNIMFNILRILFGINGEKYILMILFRMNDNKYKLEYPTIFNEEFFRDNVYHYLIKNITITANP